MDMRDHQETNILLNINTSKSPLNLKPETNKYLTSNTNMYYTVRVIFYRFNKVNLQFYIIVRPDYYVHSLYSTILTSSYAIAYISLTFSPPMPTSAT